MSITPFSQLHHICIVVHDLQRAVEFYESVGVGPWHAFPSLTAFAQDLQSPDNNDFLMLTYCFADVGGIQLQLCAPPPGNTPQRKFLENHGEGVFHLGFAHEEVDRGEALAKPLGLETLLRGRLQNGHGFTYFKTRNLGAGVTLQIRSSARS